MRTTAATKASCRLAPAWVARAPLHASTVANNWPPNLTRMRHDNAVRISGLLPYWTERCTAKSVVRMAPEGGVSPHRDD